MPSMSLTARNEALNGITITQLSLHSQFSTSGAFELTGGTPAYARRPIVAGSASSASRPLVTATAPVIFDVPPASTVGFVGMWDAIPTFLGMIPLGDGTLHQFVLSTDGSTLFMGQNIYSNGTQVVTWTGPELLLPEVETTTDLSEGVGYYVVGASTTSMQLSLTLGGAPLVFVIEPGAGYLQQFTPVTFSGQDSLTILALSLLAPPSF